MVSGRQLFDQYFTMIQGIASSETIDTFSPKYRICRNIYPKQVWSNLHDRHRNL